MSRSTSEGVSAGVFTRSPRDEISIEPPMTPASKSSQSSCAALARDAPIDWPVRVASATSAVTEGENAETLNSVTL